MQGICLQQYCACDAKFSIRNLTKVSHIAFFTELELVGKFFKKATKKNWKTLSDHALQAHVRSRLGLLHVDNFEIILSLQKQLNLKKNNKC